MEGDKYMTLGGSIRGARETLRMSQVKLAHKAGISQNYLSEIENDKASPTVDVCRKIATALGISLTSLFPANQATPERVNILCRVRHGGSELVLYERALGPADEE